ncbi:MAG: thiamine pyrophosphate-dependent enzyme [Bacillota bacterium]|nr:thiamine pyrophosphate-dependent enzyme [Bacillota bacterium]
MRPVFEPTRALRPDAVTHYCPGCTHGVAHRLVGEVLEELGLLERTVGVASVGCSVLAYKYFLVDMQEAAHGRAPAVATAIKRVLPDRVVFAYQGDGDLAAIGTAEIVHAAARGENITVLFINNANYGMTSGQMAPTTLVGQRTTTTPLGRDPVKAGHPIRVAELLNALDGPAYIARGSLHDTAHILQAKRYIRKAFQAQLERRGFSLVELLSSCPTNWGLEPVEALHFIRDRMVPHYPLGEFRKPEGVR